MRIFSQFLDHFELKWGNETQFGIYQKKLSEKTTTLGQKRNKKVIWEKANAGQQLVNKLSTMFNGWVVKREREVTVRRVFCSVKFTCCGLLSRQHFKKIFSPLKKQKKKFFFCYIGLVFCSFPFPYTFSRTKYKKCGKHFQVTFL